ncbi:MAG TPA: hypothetical protein VFJ90_13715 [Candidatus Didemnitutus sp.]|nr:hypothetical protein [Candidatus Didemnitutus sp.]
MLYYLLAAAVVLHTYFWGAGLACLATPRRWRGVAWAFAPLFGFALQSAVVWAGAHTAVAGTNHYAWASELLPLALLVFAWRRRPGKANWRSLAFVAGLMVAAGWTLLSPLPASTRGLTSTSLGSCDHADYAAGARVFQEFSRHDRVGFLGLTEVTKVGSADTFFDFWLRLNHFTPSALLAHNGTIFDCRPHELVSLTAVALVLLNLPIVLLLARVAVGLRGKQLALVATIYAFSPLTAYAVHHGALGQLYAAHGIAALTLVAFGVFRWSGPVRPWSYAPLTLAALWLLAGSYNFILTVALAPAAAWALAWLWLRRDARSVAQTGVMVTTMLAACAVLFWGRFDGLIERFRLFEQYNFGWAVPLLTPEGWLGLVSDTALHPRAYDFRVGMMAVIVALYFFGVMLYWIRGARHRALAALTLVAPVAVGWAMLSWESQVRANASYDAFKIISVFYPGLLAGMMCWFAAFRSAKRNLVVSAGLFAAIVLAFNLALAGQFRRQMMTPPLLVDRTLIELGKLESESRVASVNMRIDDFWARLWANYFLLRKPQYFSVHTYEGRLNTALKGEWDLSDSLLKSVPLAADSFLTVNNRFHLERVGAPGQVIVNYGDGWHAIEGEGNNRWRWTKGDARVEIAPAGGGPVCVRLALQIRAVSPRVLRLALDGREIGSWPLDGSMQTIPVDAVDLPAGKSVLVLMTDRPAEIPGGGDARQLSLALYEMKVEALPAR